MALRVIGAGIGRTGTSSLKIALEKLGFEKCYHMDQVLKNPSHVAMWMDAADGNHVNWDALFEGYEAAVDMPTYVFYSELMSHYPGAKVVLTLRDPEKWYESASQTIFRFPSRPLMLLIRIASLFKGELKPLVKIAPMAHKVGLEYFFKNDLSKEHVIEIFKTHNAAVQRRVPPERLLIYDVVQGWEPLCDFLDVPVPEAPFPHANTREQFASRS